MYFLQDEVAHVLASVLWAPVRCIRPKRDQPESHLIASLKLAPVSGDEPLDVALRGRGAHGLGQGVMALVVFRTFRNAASTFSWERHRVALYADSRIRQVTMLKKKDSGSIIAFYLGLRIGSKHVRGGDIQVAGRGVLPSMQVGEHRRKVRLHGRLRLQALRTLLED